MEDETSGADATPGRRIGALDALRTVAVAAVIAYHLDRLPGGWVGVDLFFVLSGFLITTLLLTSRTSGGGITLGGFWGRRARRLLPAALVCIAVTIAVGTVLEPDAVGAWARTGAASAAWVGNWQQVQSGESYFDAFATPNALKHLWSLSVEEQFYLAWPLLLAGLVVVVARRAVGWAVAVLATLLAGGSAILMAVWAPSGGDDPTRIWYGTDTRALTPLAGAALAGVVVARGWPEGRRSRALVLAAGAVGAAILVATAVGLDDRSSLLWRGGAVVIALAGVAVIAAASLPGRLQDALGAVRPVVWVGAALSYALYLWHWPVIVILSPTRVGLDGWALDGLRVAVTVGLATLSWRFVEQPVRAGVRPWPMGSRAVPIAFAAVSVVVIGGVGVALRHPTTSERMADMVEASGGSASDQVVVAEPPTEAPPTDRSPQRVSLFGDSVAWTYSVRATPEVLADHATVALYNHADWSCQLLVAERRTGGRTDPADSNCRDWPERWAEQVAGDRPDVALLSVGVWEVFDRRFDDRWLEFGTPEFDVHLDETLDRALTILGSTGARVAVTTAAYPDRPPGSESPAEWIDGAATRARFDHLNQRLRAAAARHGGLVVDLGSDWCPTPDGPCSDDPLRYDGVHFEPDQAAPRVLGFVLDELWEQTAAEQAASDANASE